MDAVLDAVFAFFKSVEGQAVAIGVVVDFVFRIFPSKKPLGVIHLVVGLLGKLGALLIKLEQVSDKILPQNLKPSELVIPGEKQK